MVRHRFGLFAGIVPSPSMGRGAGWGLGGRGGEPLPPGNHPRRADAEPGGAEGDLRGGGRQGQEAADNAPKDPGRGPERHGRPAPPGGGRSRRPPTPARRSGGGRSGAFPAGVPPHTDSGRHAREPEAEGPDAAETENEGGWKGCLTRPGSASVA